MSNYWNERYSKEEYAYGDEPNVFLAEQLKLLKPGVVIFPCEGEGRNAVYAASQGWSVHAFDSSEAGKTKALLLAQKKAQTIQYIIDDALDVQYPKATVDAVVFIFAHFPPSIRAAVNQKAIDWLKPGGKIILEAFNPNQLQNTSGGPQDISMLYTEDMLRADFVGLEIELLQLIETSLSEGKFHQGKADVIRFVGVKK
jgi:SAM-dependent methyltransferase